MQGGPHFLVGNLGPNTFLSIPRVAAPALPEDPRGAFGTQLIDNKKKMIKHSHLKKRVIAEKCSVLLSTNVFVLFFHYNGTKKCSWPPLKKSLGYLCKSLLVPNRLLVELWAQEVDPRTQFIRGVEPIPAVGEKFPSTNSWQDKQLARGSTLLVGCSSLAQVVAVVETCKEPQFICTGGTYNKHPSRHAALAVNLASPANAPADQRVYGGRKIKSAPFPRDDSITLMHYLDVKKWVTLHSKEKETYTALLQPLVHWQLFISLLQLLSTPSIIPWPSLNISSYLMQHAASLHPTRKE